MIATLTGDDLYSHIRQNAWEIAVQYADGSLMLRCDGLSAQSLCRRGYVSGKVHEKKGLRYLTALTGRSEIRRVINLAMPELQSSNTTKAKQPDLGWAPRYDKAKSGCGGFSTKYGVSALAALSRA